MAPPAPPLSVPPPFPAAGEAPARVELASCHPARPGSPRGRNAAGMGQSPWDKTEGLYAARDVSLLGEITGR